MIGNKTWYYIGNCGECINWRRRKPNVGTCKKGLRKTFLKHGEPGCSEFDDKENYES